MERREEVEPVSGAHGLLEVTHLVHELLNGVVAPYGAALDHLHRREEKLFSGCFWGNTLQRRCVSEVVMILVGTASRTKLEKVGRVSKLCRYVLLRTGQVSPVTVPSSV